MRNGFDHLGQTIGHSALSPCGITVLEDRIAPNACRADIRHEPDPARATERARLGLLGRIASILCLIELYSSAPGVDEALACLGKLIAFRQQRLREALKKRKAMAKLGQKPPAEPFVNPLGWLITAGRPSSVLLGLGAIQAVGWPEGVYFSTGAILAPGAALQGLDDAGGMLRVGIVVASELPRDPSTLLVRFMAGGPLLRDAIAELEALEDGAFERTVAEEILVDLREELEKKASATPEEEEFIVSMGMTFSQARKVARDEGEAKGRVDEAVRNLLTVLGVRGLAVPDTARERILAQRDAERLERWLAKAVIAASVGDVLDE